jgi:hypothetical protein
MLRLTRASESRKLGPWSDDDFDVFDGEQRIGHILRSPAQTDRPWIWNITWRNEPTARDRGTAPSLGAALAELKIRWDSTGRTLALVPYPPLEIGVSMETVEVTRSGHTDQFSVVMTQGNDTIRCMVSVALGDAQDNRTDDEKHRAALSKAKGLAKALDAAISDS